MVEMELNLVAESKLQNILNIHTCSSFKNQNLSAFSLAINLQLVVKTLALMCVLALIWYNLPMIWVWKRVHACAYISPYKGGRGVQGESLTALLFTEVSFTCWLCYIFRGGQTIPSNVNMELDLPVDPNEPTYCYCGQVSYGEMIACDNPEVSTLHQSDRFDAMRIYIWPFVWWLF